MIHARSPHAQDQGALAFAASLDETTPRAHGLEANLVGYGEARVKALDDVLGVRHRECLSTVPRDDEPGLTDPGVRDAPAFQFGRLLDHREDRPEDGADRLTDRRRDDRHGRCAGLVTHEHGGDC